MVHHNWYIKWLGTTTDQVTPINRETNIIMSTNKQTRFIRTLFKNLYPGNIGALTICCNIFLGMWKSNGYQEAVRYYKFSRLLITRYLCGKPLIHNPWRIATTGGFPVKFIFLKGMIDSGDISKIRIVLTLMNISKYYTPSKEELKKIKPKYESITDPYKGKD